MDRTLFFDGMDVLEEDLDNIEITKVAAIQRTRTDIATQVGILTGLNVTNPVAFTLRVSSGVAYDSNGEALVQTGNQDVLVGPGDVGFYLVIRHTQTDGTPVEHPITGILNNTRRADGTSRAMTAAPAVTDVVLAQLTALSGGGTATLDVLQDPDGPRVYWSARIGNNTITDDMLDQNGEVITHIHSFGTGVVSPTNPHGQSLADFGFVPDTTPTVHQLKDHTNGIEPDSATTTCLVTINAAPAPDQINITQLTVGDSILVNGNRITNVPGVTPTNLTFLTAGVNPELYEIYVDGNGTVSKNLRAQYGGPATVTGVYVVDVSPLHEAGTFVLDQALGPGLMVWDGGLDMDNPSTDGFMICRRPGKPEQWILLWIDVSALDPGSPADSITIFASIAEQNNRLLLANVNWSGSATGFLGYGNWGSSGSPYDKRRRGNLGSKALSTEAVETYIERYFKETRSDGIAFLDPGSQALGDAFVGGSSTFTIAAGVGYASGKRVSWPETQLTAPDGSTTYVWIDETGTVKQSISKPFTFGFDDTTTTFGGIAVSDNVLKRGIAIGYVAAAAGLLTVVENTPYYLSHADRDGEVAHSEHQALPGNFNTGTFVSTSVWRSTGGSVLSFPTGRIRTAKRLNALIIRIRGTGGVQSVTAVLKRDNGDGTVSTIGTITATNPPNAWATYAVSISPAHVVNNTSPFTAGYFWELTGPLANTDFANPALNFAADGNYF